jgi:hypothetical protein
MRISGSILLIIFCSACVTASRYRHPVNWDLDGNDQLSRYEFVAGYAESNYFLAWCRCKKLSIEKFYAAIFKKLDTNGNDSLTTAEFDKRVNYYNPKGFSSSRKLWNNVNGTAVSKKQFMSNGMDKRLFTYWDASKDGWVSQDELASGMFAISDLNDDQIVNSLEFNIWKVNR